MRAKPTAFKHLKTPKCETLRNLKGPLLSPLLFPVFTNIYNDDAKCYPENMTMLYADDATRFRRDDDTGFCHNKKKLEAALNAKIICDDDAECYPEGMSTPYEDNATGFCQDDATGFCHSMKKLEKLFKSPSGCIKCKDHKNYTRGMKIVLSAYVI